MFLWFQGEYKLTNPLKFDIRIDIRSGIWRRSISKNAIKIFQQHNYMHDTELNYNLEHNI